MGERQYLGTQRFLPVFHHYQRLQKVFNGFTEKEKAPKALNGEHVYQQVKNSTRDMKKRNKIQLKRICERSGQYFLIARMKFFVCRYCLDVMHIEKNVCDSIIDTLLNKHDKNKDGVKNRKD